ncbi:MAG: methylated-DNA--[protein]-cysteine S-methyltransferase [Gammaproteobacteria bacterium]|nr:methylated-DNA--[protein]-cysteine S-methyltransferase [Gammaproteobacteria bacterium]MDD9894261.1 methylated-DNA--[protein]-cysteine S-methyltransferase [Gammaproteobacteria bacterium]MDD9960436.1 methylated-DNA--[protein]-cysteine S-methyltransferase [Gammaproteobacteria bacterium]
MTTYYHYHTSPIGKLLLAGDGDCLSLLGFPSGSMARKHEQGWAKDSNPFKEVIYQLDAYFAGELQDFDLALAPHGTAFQRTVWDALTEIPFGETWSYGQLAKHIGRPKASRAVGAANGLNPIPVIIPCHRVIGRNGKLTGFGGGIKTKEFLLNLEAEAIAPGLNFG